jgi:hypothetical protein
MSVLQSPYLLEIAAITQTAAICVFGNLGHCRAQVAAVCCWSCAPVARVKHQGI